MVWYIKFDSEIYSSPFCLQSFENEKIDESIILAISCDGTVYISDLNGNLMLNEKNVLNNLKNCCYSSPIVYKNKMFIGCRDNFVYSINLFWNLK